MGDLISRVVRAAFDEDQAEERHDDPGLASIQTENELRLAREERRNAVRAARGYYEFHYGNKAA